ncbi:MAG: FecR family protein [Candidatus Pseudomonas colombiensis]|nr:MAG: FecR family protein [Pseudomonas sp.]
MNANRLPAPVEQAVEWMALQRSGSMSDADRQRFSLWLHASPDNQQAWARLEQRLGQAFEALPAVSRQVLSRPGHSRRHLLRGALGLAGVGLSIGWLQGQGWLSLMGNDLSTGVAQRKPFTLEDGSRVLLNAQSRVDLAFDRQQRTLILREGALNIQVAHDPTRPLVVRTAFGEARALGTRFSVSLGSSEARLWVQESQVQLSVPGQAPHTFGVGQGAAFDGRRIDRLPASQASAWESGQLVVHDQPLGEVIDALRPYRRGVLRVNGEASRLRVSGVFPLDNSAQALRSLQEVLPIQVEQHLGWWTQISLR